jgi:hypothetical protein
MRMKMRLIRTYSIHGERGMQVILTTHVEMRDYKTFRE